MKHGSDTVNGIRVETYLDACTRSREPQKIELKNSRAVLHAVGRDDAQSRIMAREMCGQQARRHEGLLSKPANNSGKRQT